MEPHKCLQNERLKNIISKYVCSVQCRYNLIEHKSPSTKSENIIKKFTAVKPEECTDACCKIPNCATASMIKDHING